MTEEPEDDDTGNAAPRLPHAGRRGGVLTAWLPAGLDLRLPALPNLHLG